MASPTIDGTAHGTAGGATSPSAVLTTTGSNDIIGCFVYASANNGGAITAPKITAVSGTGTAGWAQRGELEQTNIGGTGWALSYWTGSAASPLSAVTITATLAHTTDACAIILFGVKGAAVASNDSHAGLPLSGLSGTPSAKPILSLTTDKADDLLVCCIGVTNFGGTMTHPPAGWALLDNVTNNGGGLGCEMGAGDLSVSATQSAVSVQWGADAGQINSNDRVPFFVDAFTSDGITCRAGATGPSTNSATAYTMSLPTGISDGDVVFAVSPHTGGTAPTVPAGWTALGNGKCQVGAGYKVWHTGDSTSITMTDTTGTFWQGVTTCYSGCDTSNPVDDTGVHVVRGDNISMNLYRAPSLVPSFNNEVVVGLYGRSSSSSGGTWTAPSGWTSRQTSTGGPGVGAFDKPLTDGTETGNGDIAHLSQLAAYEFGCSVLLRPASAVAATHVATVSQGATQVFDANASTFTPDLSILDIRNGDMVLVAFANGTTTSTTPTGYTLQAIDNGISLYTHPWLTGDTTTPSWVFTAGFFRLYTAVLLRTKGGVGPAAFDTSGHSNGSGTVTTPSLTPSSTNEFLACFFGDQSTSGGEAITSAPSLVNDVLGTFGPEMVYGFARNISSATGTFSTTLATANTLGAISALFIPQAAAATFVPTLRSHSKYRHILIR